ncbi:putative cysteine ligase BshC [Paenibacillus sp. J31TS4]|uniref:bacillithiol biosynthesis cysteine-adding enzyme BshC n=1 Tax=Paenibacillus sp. J31TS4 TaxID=2807195 RepID=UPI001B03F101|nr:bacillithiol biosynthesis cysteine-adding enzyme BshC [Paenibacillus sp. J31TS4]GIP39666.1 putative cysteine ligase BshC [Paenibacillus sp. J31TS4]
MNLEEWIRRTGRTLAGDYSHEYDIVRELYDYSPWDKADWQERAKWVDEKSYPAANRTELIHSLIRYNDKLHNDPASFAAIEKLKRDDALVIVGGQQAGLFSGPLLTIHKIITILQAAREAEKELGRPVVPIFWIAGEDHDFDEVNHIYSLSTQQSVDKIKLEHPTGIRTSISRLAIDSWEDALKQLDGHLMQTEFKGPLMETLLTFAGKSATLSDFFGRMMAWLFGKHGLVLLDSDDPGIRKLEGRMFAELLRRSKEVNDQVLEGYQRVRELGYTPQADATEDNANLFLFDAHGERHLLRRSGDRFVDKKAEMGYSLEELTALAAEEPERFSNNVMTRPVMQDYLLPVLGAVLGPGELAYWGMTKGVFHTLGMRMPVLIPRREFTLIEGTVKKHMEKYELSPDDVAERFEERRDSWLKQQDELHLEEQFAGVKRQVEELYAPVLATVGAINPGMKKLGEMNLQKIIEQIAFLEARATEAHQSQFDASLRQLERIRLTIQPLGKPQERVYNVLAYLNKYGSGWIDELIDVPFRLRPLHTIVYL